MKSSMSANYVCYEHKSSTSNGWGVGVKVMLLTEWLSTEDVKRRT